MGSSPLSLILLTSKADQPANTRKFGKSDRQTEQTFGPSDRPQLMESCNKENIPMKQFSQDSLSFLTCSEIFCEPMFDSKPPQPQQAKPRVEAQQQQQQQQQLYPKLLQVKAQVDQTLVRDDRVLLNLIKNESRYLPRYQNYFKTVQVEVKPHMRKVVSDWMLEVCQELCCPPEVFCLAMNLMDRFLAKTRIEKSQLQLLGAVCLFLSSKFKEAAPIPSEKLVMYTDFSVSLESIREWELFVLYKLKWDLSACTGLDYLDHILPKLALEASVDTRQVRRHTETVIALSATHYLFSYVRPSVIAASAIAVTYRSLTANLTEEAASPFLHHLRQVTQTEAAELDACSTAMFQTLPHFLTASKPNTEDAQECLVNMSIENSPSLLLQSC